MKKIRIARGVTCTFEDIDNQTYKDYVLHLKSTLGNEVSINSCLRDLITLNKTN